MKNTTTGVESSKYLKLLQKSTEQKDQEQYLYNAEDALSQLQGDLKETKRSLAKQQRKTTDLKGTFPLDTQAISNSKQEEAKLEAGVKFLTERETELFG